MAGDALDFVNSITDPTSVLNLNDGTTWKFLREGSSFDPPQLRTSNVSTLLFHGERRAAEAFSNRSLIIRLQLKAATSDAIATATNNLLQCLLSDAITVLRWKPYGATKAVFYHTLRASPRTVNDILIGHKDIVLELEADPFAYGEAVSLGTFTVNSDPAAGSNGTFFDIPASGAGSVPGNFETPLFLKFTAADVARTGRATTAIAVRAGGEPSGAPMFFQAESMSLATNTATQTNSSAWSGSGANRVRASSLTNSFVVRSTLSSAYPATSSSDIRGSYRVFLRGAQTVGTDEIRGRLEWSADGNVWIPGREEIFPANGGIVPRWWDLGLVQFPIGYDPRFYGLSGAKMSVAGLRFRLALARTSGSGNFDYDVFRFMPADRASLYVKWPAASSSDFFVVDSFLPAAYGQSSAGVINTADLFEMSGGPPNVLPGVKNRIHLLADVGQTSTAGDTLPADFDVEAIVWPRFIRERTA